VNNRTCIRTASMVVLSWVCAVGAQAFDSWINIASASYPRGDASSPYNEFGNTVAISGDWVFVGAPSLSSSPPGTTNPGGVIVYRLEGTSLTYRTTLRPQPNAPVPTGSFGVGLTADGDRLIVGSDRERLQQGYLTNGVLHEFRLHNQSWDLVQRFSLPGGIAPGGSVGGPLACSGTNLFVGVCGQDIGTRGNAGAVHRFEFDGESWVYRDRLIPDDLQTGSLFGWSLAFAGNRLIVGAVGDQIFGSSAGAAYVFQRTDSSWQSCTRLEVPGLSPFDGAGLAVAFAGDRACVATPFDIVGGIESGSVHVFQNAGSGWVQSSRVTPETGRDAQQFGSVMAADGTTIVCAEYTSSVSTWPTNVTALELTSGGGVSQSRLQLSSGQYAGFGKAVAIRDGKIVVTQADTANTGFHRVHVFVRAADCNNNGIADPIELAQDPMIDCNGNGQIDSCEIAVTPALDCDGDGRIDSCAIAAGLVMDCNANGRPDSCEIADGAADLNHNGRLDSCECLGDVTGDRRIGLDDLALLLSNFGRPSGATTEDGDIDGDQAVTLLDLAILLSRFGTLCR